MTKLASTVRRRETLRSIEAVPSPERHDTPLLPGPPLPEGPARGTLTVLTGTNAGQIAVIPSAGLVIGRSEEADLIADDPNVSRRHARVAGDFEGAFFVEDLASRNGTYVGDARVDRALLSSGDRIQLGGTFCMRFALTAEVDEIVQRRLYESSVRDPLTHVYNRRHFADRLLVETSYASRAQQDIALLMIDVDGLKGLNDRYGHLAGDRALWAIANRVQAVIRVEDLFARYGGDEFVVLARATGAAQAKELAERVGLAVRLLHLAARGQTVRVTVSVGVATMRELEPADSLQLGLLALADTRLYEAKAAGRDCVRP